MNLPVFSPIITFVKAIPLLILSPWLDKGIKSTSTDSEATRSQQMGIRNEFYWGEAKRNFTTEKNSTKRNFVSKFFDRHLSKIYVSMVNCAVCSMLLACKACLSNGMSPTFHDLVSSAQRNKIAWISKRDPSLRKLFEAKRNQNKTNFRSGHSYSARCKPQEQDFDLEKI